MINLNKIFRYIKYAALAAFWIAWLYNISSATLVEFVPWEPQQISDFTYDFDQHFNVYTDWTSVAAFYTKRWDNNNWIISYGWVNWDLYFYSKKFSDSTIVQWYLSKWCINGSCTYTLDDIIEQNPTIVKVWFGQTSSTDYFNSNWFNYKQSQLCFYDDNNKSYCVACSFWTDCDSWLGDSLNLNFWDFTDLALYSWENSPLTQSDTPIEVPSYEINSWYYTNLDILLGYQKMWLETLYCYWWFPINNLFPVDWNPRTFTWYKFWTGARINQLYDLYSWDFATPKYFLSAFFQTYLNWQLDGFYWKPKAMYMFIDQYYQAEQNHIWTFTLYDIWNYCDLSYRIDNWLDPWAIYTWDSLEAIYAFESTRWTTTWRDEWFSLSSWVLDVFWNETWFSNAEEFFWRLSNLFNEKLYSNLTQQTWILPSYIIFFLFAIILIRIISRSNG